MFKKIFGSMSVASPLKTSNNHAALLEVVKDFTLCRESKLISLIEIAADLKRRGIQGDFVECGVYKGGAAAVIAASGGGKNKVWLYDSFEGMPNTSGRDGSEAAKWAGTCVGSVDEVKTVFRRVGISDYLLNIRKGWFVQTFKEPSAEIISFLHVDADWYDSVMISLETFYDRVVEGGVVVLDDFGHWEGCRDAFYDFCQKRQIRPLLERFENDQAFWIKGRLHNRDGWVHQPKL